MFFIGINPCIVHIIHFRFSSLSSSIFPPRDRVADVFENNEGFRNTKVDFDHPVYEMEIEEGSDGSDLETDWMVEQEERSLEPFYESVEIVNLGTEENRREVKVGDSLDRAEKDRLVELLQNFQDIFAWSYQDMPGLDENNSNTSLANKRRVQASKAKVTTDEAEMDTQNQGRSTKAIRSRVLAGSTIHRLGL